MATKTTQPSVDEQNPDLIADQPTTENNAENPAEASVEAPAEPPVEAQPAAEAAEADPAAQPAEEAPEAVKPAKKPAKKPAAPAPAEEPAEEPVVEEPAAPADAPAVEPEVVAASEPAPEPAPEPAEAPAAEEEPAEAMGEDFSDEEAMLAASAPDLDLGEEDEEESHDHASLPGEDLSGKTKEQINEYFETLMAERPIQSLRRDVEGIKIAFYKIHRAETEKLRKLYEEAGGNPDDFVAPDDAAEIRLKELLGEYRRKRDLYNSSIDAQKEENLKVKLQIIEELKELVNSTETLNHTFNVFHALQQKWRETGLVPLSSTKELWDTYNYHVENFYSYVKINKELRDLDLKRNYEAKVALCEQAESLILEPSVVNAFHALQKLHEQWREIGPVSPEYKESIWERFKEASARINKLHQDHFDDIKQEQKRNLDLKAELCAKTEELTQGTLVTRKDWNKASDKLTEIQKLWKTIGFAPKKENTKIYERFRKACDGFFERKREFYLGQKSEMDQNLQLKIDICLAAESLSGSDQWKKTTDELIALQRRWKEIGPVPRRHSDAIWKRFRSACDAFFTRKSSHFSSVDGEYAENLSKKRDLLQKIEQYIAAGEQFSMEAIREFQREWSSIGFVPVKQKDSIQAKYKELMDTLFTGVKGGERERSMERFRGRVTAMKGGGDRKVKSERDRLFNRVRQLEGDIATLENNIGFFSKSKNAEAMVRDVREKIEKAKEEMAQTVEKINIIDQQNNE